MSTDRTPQSSESFRTYRGRTLDELLPQIAEELGPDAIILREREGLVGGVGGFFARRFVEVDACPGEGSSIDVYDEGDLPELSAAPAGAALTGAPARPALPAADDFVDQADDYADDEEDGADDEPPEPEEIDDRFDHQLEVASYWLKEQDPMLDAEAEPEPVRPEPEPESEPEPELEPEPDSQPEPGPKPAKPKPATGHRPPANRLGHDEIEFVTSQLTGKGADPEWAENLVRSAAAHLRPLTGGVATAALQTLARALPATAPLPVSGAAIALVGSGGSGKTTVVAALANAYQLSEATPVSVISLPDRNASGELLELLDRRIPLQSLDPMKAGESVSRARRDGVVLLDTATCTPTDPDAVRALTQDLDQIKLDAIYVALPATLSLRSARNTIRGLWPLHPTGLVVTHADESDQLAICAETAIEYGLPLIYLHRVDGGHSKLRNIEPYDFALRLLRPGTSGFR